MTQRQIRLRLVTWNAHIARRRPRMARRLAIAKKAIAHIARQSDVAVFQEFGQHPALLKVNGSKGWDPRGAQPPHMWRSAAVRAADHDGRLLARGRRVGKIPGFRAVLDDYQCSVGRYVVDGFLVVVIAVHLPAHIEHRVGEVAKGARGDMWRECVEAVAAIAAAELALGADVVAVIGDWNMRLSAGKPFRPFTDLGADRIRPKVPTHRSREIDGGFVIAASGVSVKVEHCHVMRGRRLPFLPAPLFDHRPVHATLEITRSTT